MTNLSLIISLAALLTFVSSNVFADESCSRVGILQNVEQTNKELKLGDMEKGGKLIPGNDLAIYKTEDAFIVLPAKLKLDDKELGTMSKKVSSFLSSGHTTGIDKKQANSKTQRDATKGVLPIILLRDDGENFIMAGSASSSFECWPAK